MLQRLWVGLFLLSSVIVTVGCDEFPFLENDANDGSDANETAVTAETDSTADASAKVTPIFSPSPQPRPYNPTTTAATGSEIAVLVVYANDTNSHFLGVEKNLLFNPNKLTTMSDYLEWIFARINTLYDENSANQQLVLAHHAQIDFSDLAESDDWRRELMFAYMNHRLSNLSENQQAMMTRLRTLRDEHNADLVIYWRSTDDPSSAVNGAAPMPEGSMDAFTQLTYFGFPSVSTMAHEIGHLEEAQHEEGYESPTAVTYFVDDQEVSDYYRTIMRTSDTKSASDAPVTIINRFSSADTELLGEVACSVYIPLDQGTKVETRVCRFDSAVPLGDANHNVLPKIVTNGAAMALFR